MKSRWAAVILGGMLSAQVVSAAEDDMQAYSAYILGDYSEAFEYFEAHKDVLGSGSLYLLGNLYYHGKGTEQNTTRAIETYKAAATAGNTMAAKALVGYYDSNSSSKAARTNAIHWYEVIREEADSDILCALGQVYEADGQYTKAAQAYEEAIDKFDQSTPRNLLAELYLQKKLKAVPANKPLRLLRQSARMNDKEAQYRLGVELSTLCRNEWDRDEAMRWLKRASYKHGDAMHLLQQMEANTVCPVPARRKKQY